MRFDKHMLNVLNKREVINCIRTHNSVFKAEIARMTGLSIPTVMKIVDEFVEKGLVRETGKGESTGGKPPRMLEFVHDAMYSIGVDIGKTNISVLLMDLAGNVIGKSVVPTGETEDPAQIIGKVTGEIHRVMEATKIPRECILGIGIGLPGLIDSENGIVLFSPDFGWEHFDVRTPFAKEFSMPILIENSTRAMALGEKWFGVATEVENFICLNVGYGIAAAFVLDGELYYGKSGTCGEFGHLTLKNDGPKCDCGNYGCLEALSSGNAIAKTMKQLLQEGKESTVIKFTPNHDMVEIEAKTVFEAAQAGDPLSQKVVSEALEYIGIGLAGMINLFDPELIVASGGIFKNGDMVLEEVSTSMKQRRMKYAGRKVKILLSKLGSDGTAIGAATLLIKKMIENGGSLKA